MALPSGEKAGPAVPTKINLFDDANYRPITYKVEFLTEQNYTLWKMKLLTVLTEHGVDDVATGAITKPKAGGSKDEQITWMRKDARARGLLLERINHTHSHLIDGAATCAEMWKRIELRYQKDARMSPVYAIQAMFSHSWDMSEDSLEANLSYIQSKVNDLREFKGELNDLMELLHSLAIIHSLPESWSQTVKVLMSKETIDLDNVISTLKRMQAHMESEKNTETALAIRAKGKSKGKDAKVKVKCENCKKLGHPRENCWAEGGGRAGQGPANNKFGNGKSTGKSGTKTVNLADGDESSSDVEASIVTVGDEPSEDQLDVTIAAASVKANRWLFDTGATAHICGDQRMLTRFHDIQPIPVRGFGQGMTLYATGKGTVTLVFKPGKQQQRYRLVLDNVLFVSGSNTNVISGDVLLQKGIKLEGDKGGFKFFTNGELIARAIRSGGQYVFQTDPDVQVNALSSKEPNLREWHRRFGHLGYDNLRKLIDNGLTTGLDIDTQSPSYAQPGDCGQCHEGKMHRDPFPTSSSCSTKVLQLVHSDLMGPNKPPTSKGYLYVMTFLDDATRYSWLYLLKDKSAALTAFNMFLAEVERENDTKLKRFRSDGGGEYTSNEFKATLAKLGIKADVTTPRTPQQNGAAERLNRTLSNTVHSMKSDAAAANSPVPENLWADLYAHTNHIRNISPSTRLQNKTPWEAYHGTKPDVSNLRPFYCDVYVLSSTVNRKKLDPRAKKLKFIGFERGTKGYKCYDPKTRQITISRDVRFPGDKPAADEENSEDDGDAPNRQLEGELSSPDGTQTTDSTTDAPAATSTKKPRPCIDYGPPSRESARLKAKGNKQPNPPANPNADVPTPEEEEAQKVQREGEIINFVSVNVALGQEPVNYHDAISGEDADKWNVAMNTEWTTLNALGTFELVSLPPGRTAIGCKWVYRIKTDEAGNPTTYKARLVAQGFSQKHLVDFDKTFSTVGRTTSFKVLADLAARNNMEFHQLDVKAAYLNGKLDEVIFMRQPPGFAVEGK